MSGLVVLVYRLTLWWNIESVSICFGPMHSKYVVKVIRSFNWIKHCLLMSILISRGFADFEYLGCFQGSGHRGIIRGLSYCSSDPIHSYKSQSKKQDTNNHIFASFVGIVTRLDNSGTSCPSCCLQSFHFGTFFRVYRQTSNISHTKSPKLNVSRLDLWLYLPNPLKQGVESRMKM